MVTMSKVAQASGVSRSTVSFVLSGRTAGVRIPDETRERVLNVAAQLGYRPNAMARAIVAGKSRSIAFLVRNLDSAFVPQSLEGAQKVATREGYLIHLIPFGSSAESAQAAVQRCAEYRVSAAIALAAPLQLLEILKNEAQTYRFPVAAIDDVPPLDWGVRVTSDNRTGVRQAFEHLHQLGHNRFAYLTGPHSSTFARERAAMFLELLEQYDLSAPDSHLIWGDWWDPDINEPLIEAILRDAATRPTALMCASDWGAMAALRVARRLDLSVPDELSIIGFSNLPMAHFGDPPLSSIEQRFDLMGEVAMENLIQRCQTLELEPDDPDFAAPVDLQIEPHLVFRGSTGPAPN